MTDSPWTARARIYALQVAQGVIDYGTALAALLALARTSPGWRADVSADTIAHLLNLHVADAEGNRALTESHVVRRVRPLIAEYAPPEMVFRTAEQINEERGRPLLSYEVRALVREEMARKLAADRPQVRRRVR